jgi:hypothetical protein
MGLIGIVPFRALGHRLLEKVIQEGESLRFRLRSRVVPALLGGRLVDRNERELVEPVFLERG